jgi:2,4'-dihydroxyacetophenone dioxygenase
MPAAPGATRIGGAMSAQIVTAPGVGHVPESAAPWVDVAGGQRRLVHADAAAGIWILGVRYEAGAGKERHHHTGPVYGWTISGRWYYREHGEMYVAGSFVHEPAGSAHELVVPEDNDGITEVLFVVHGANLQLGADDEILHVTDAASFARRYRALCIDQGHRPPALTDFIA